MFCFSSLQVKGSPPISFIVEFLSIYVQCFVFWGLSFIFPRGHRLRNEKKTETPFPLHLPSLLTNHPKHLVTIGIKASKDEGQRRKFMLLQCFRCYQVPCPHFPPLLTNVPPISFAPAESTPSRASLARVRAGWGGEKCL